MAKPQSKCKKGTPVRRAYNKHRRGRVRAFLKALRKTFGGRPVGIEDTPFEARP